MSQKFLAFDSLFHRNYLLWFLISCMSCIMKVGCGLSGSNAVV